MYDNPYVYTFEKDRHWKYTDISENLAEAGGCESVVNAIGITDYQMPWCGHAKVCAESDRRALDFGSFRAYEMIQTVTGFKHILIYKYATKDGGVAGFFEILDQSAESDYLKTFNIRKGFYDRILGRYISKLDLQLIGHVCLHRTRPETAALINRGKDCLDKQLKRLQAEFGVRSNSALASLCNKMGLASLAFYQDEYDFFKQEQKNYDKSYAGDTTFRNSPIIKPRSY